MQNTDLVTNSDSIPTMTSLEIAELTGKRHGNVIRDIEATIKQLKSEVEGNPDVGYLVNQGFTRVIDSYTKNTKCYNLSKIACDLVISGYSVKYRLAIIVRWQELEAKEELSLAQPTESENWQIARTTGQQVRRSITDSIKLLVDYTVEQGEERRRSYQLLLAKLPKQQDVS